MLFIFWLFVLTFGAVKCSYISENYIIEEPDIDVPKAFDTSFKVYWNVPTKQCRSKNIPFDDLLKKYSITYNKNDRFEGEHITILYDGGYIPSILKSDGAKYTLKNGGLPQEGNLELHLIAFRESVNRLIPDPDFNGVGVIDMENWRPIFRQHWSGLAPVVDLSLSIEKRHYWWWPSKWQKMEATKRFEDAARLFMEKTLTTAKQMRPKAIWGYYGYPYCYNMMSNNMVEHCSKNIKDENDRLYWLWAETTALYPSIYIASSLSTSEIKKLISGRVTEANRVKLDETLVIPYFALTYEGKGSSFLVEEEIEAVFETLQKKQASSLIVWGSSNDVNTVEKCNQLYKYINSSFGPIAKKYVQKITKIQAQINLGYEEYDSENNINDNNIYSPILTTEIPKTILHKSQESQNTFNSSIDYAYTKKYEVSDNERVNNSSNKNTNSSDNISSENNLILSNNDYRVTIPISEHTTKEKMSQNSPTTDSWNEFIISSRNVSNPVNFSVDISVTQRNADYAQTKKQEQQLKKYFYETDVSESDFKSNESDIWTVVSYDTSSEQENTSEKIKNSESLIQEFVEIDNSSTVNTNTRSFLNKDKTENTSSKVYFKNGSDLTNQQNNMSDNLLTLFKKLQLFNSTNPPAQANASELYLKFANSSNYKQYLDDIEMTLFSADGHFFNSEKISCESNYTITSPTNTKWVQYLICISWRNDTSTHINETVVKENINEKSRLFILPPQNDKEDVQRFNETTDFSIEATVSGDNNDSEFKNTLKEETKLSNMSINIKDPRTTQKFKSNTSLESTLLLPRENSSSIETVPRESNNLTTFLENTNWLLNSSVHSKETLVEENVKAQESIYTLTPKSNKQEDQPIKNTTNSNIDANLNNEYKDSDYLITLAEEPSKNKSVFENMKSDSDVQRLLPSEFFIQNFDYLITLEDEAKSMNSTLNENYTNTLENFKQENTSQFTNIAPKFDSNNTSNQEDKLIKNIATPNGEGRDYDDGYR